MYFHKDNKTNSITEGSFHIYIFLFKQLSVTSLFPSHPKMLPRTCPITLPTTSTMRHKGRLPPLFSFLSNSGSISLCLKAYFLQHTSPSSLVLVQIIRPFPIYTFSRCFSLARSCTLSSSLPVALCPSLVSKHAYTHTHTHVQVRHINAIVRLECC